jgi:hypothetical protein
MRPSPPTQLLGSQNSHLVGVLFVLLLTGLLGGLAFLAVLMVAGS